MGIRRTKHAVYELKYHLVWVPKFRANILGGEVGQYVKEVFQRIADEYEFHIDTVVQIVKSISAREVFKRFPKIRRAMWSGMIWGDGYFVRSVGDKVTADVIRKYIQYQKQEDTPSQLMMFERPST